MGFGRKKHGLGLDCGEDSIKMLILAAEGSRLRISGGCSLSRSREGVLDRDDLCAAVKDAAAALPGHTRRLPAAYGLETSRVNTVVTAFPPVGNMRKLRRMVEYQTGAVCGLSGEKFEYDFQSLPGQVEHETPVLVAVCRSTFIEECLDFCRSAKLDCEHITSNGLALINAFSALHPGEFADNALHCLLDLGTTSATLAVCGMGRLHYLTVLPFTADPVRLAADCGAALNRWQENFPSQLRATPPRQLWISGGGALLPGLAAALMQHSPFAVKCFGIPEKQLPEALGAPVTDGVCPTLVIAYGLALQALGMSTVSISLVPELLAWQLQRRRNFPLAAAAAVLFFGAALTGMLLYAMQMKRAIKSLAVQEKQLNACLELYPRLDECYRTAKDRQRLLIPLAECGFRAQRFMETLENCQKARLLSGKKGNFQDWYIYMADQFSFHRDNAPAADHDDAVPLPRNPRQRKSSAATAAALSPADGSLIPRGGESINGVANAGTTDKTAKESGLIPVEQLPKAVSVDAVPHLESMYIGGFLPVDEGSRYAPVMELQQRLNQANTFMRVDDHVDYLTTPFVARFAIPWEEFLQNNREKLSTRYTLFFLQLPFRTSLIN